jgi:hypothetical protein
MYGIISSNHFQSKPFCTFFNSAHSDADKEGPAVYTARALLRGTDSQREEYMNDCEKVYPASSSNREAEPKSLNKLSNIQNDFKIIPNPAKSIITINHFGKYDYIIIEETSGRMVLKTSIDNNLSIETFDVSSLANGIYIIKLINQINSSQAKLIINK